MNTTIRLEAWLIVVSWNTEVWYRFSKTTQLGLTSWLNQKYRVIFTKTIELRFKGKHVQWDKYHI